MRLVARQGEGWVRNSKPGPNDSGLRIRYERVGAVTRRRGSPGSRAPTGRASQCTPALPAGSVAVTPTAPLDIVGLDPRRAALLLAGGTTLAYEASRPAWAALARLKPALPPWLPVLGALLAAGPKGIRALDLDLGRQLRPGRLPSGAPPGRGRFDAEAARPYVPAASHPSPSRGGAGFPPEAARPAHRARRKKVEAAESAGRRADGAPLLPVGARAGPRRPGA